MAERVVPRIPSPAQYLKNGWAPLVVTPDAQTIQFKLKAVYDNGAEQNTQQHHQQQQNQQQQQQQKQQLPTQETVQMASEVYPI